MERSFLVLAVAKAPFDATKRHRLPIRREEKVPRPVLFPPSMMRKHAEDNGACTYTTWRRKKGKVMNHCKGDESAILRVAINPRCGLVVLCDVSGCIFSGVPPFVITKVGSGQGGRWLRCIKMHRPWPRLSATETPFHGVTR